MSSDTFWVHAEVVTDPWAGWYGPFPTLERAEEEAAGRTAPWTGEAEFAEVVRGTPGAPGRCVCEYYQGGRHRPGGSGCNRPRPVADPVIPAPVVSA
jgi:hypothetical protein